MTDDITTEVDETEGESGSGEESSVMKELRQQLKDAQKALKAVPSRSELEAEFRATVARESAIEHALVALKHPVGLRPLIEEKMGEAEVTPEGVAEALKAIGFEVTVSSDSGAESSQVVQGLAAVANLGGQIAAAAKGETGDNFDAELAATESPQDIAALMRKRGLGG